MQWFKHSTGSHDDPDLVDARNELGDKAIVIFWDILELYAEEFKHRDSEGWVRFSKFFLRSQLRRNLVTTQSVLSFYEKRGRINCKFEGNYVYIQIPKFILLSSNWTRRPTEAPTEATQEAPTEAPTAIEEEEEVEVEREEEKKKKKKEGLCGEPFISIPLAGQSEYPIYPGMIEEWKNLYPKVDVEQGLRDIRGWNLSNPTKRKTKSGIMRHINTWLAKEQNNGTGRRDQGSTGKVDGKTGNARSDGAEYPVDFEA